MIHDVIERFRYRFELWRREQREEYFGVPGTKSVEEPDYLSRFSDPKRAVLLHESNFSHIGRAGVAYFGIIAIAAQICFIIDSFIPSARFAVAIIFLVLAGLWTLLDAFFEIDLQKARKQYRQQQATKSSNQPLQLTAAGRDDQISVHEPPFTPSIPPPRQR
jgi:hypothetical protein